MLTASGEVGNVRVVDLALRHVLLGEPLLFVTPNRFDVGDASSDSDGSEYRAEEARAKDVGAHGKEGRVESERNESGVEGKGTWKGG